MIVLNRGTTLNLASSSRCAYAIRPTDKIGNVLVYAAANAGMSLTTSINLPELIS